MSQAKLNDFFSSKKKQDINPAKRRKVEPAARTTRSSRSNSLLLANPLAESGSYVGNVFKADLSEMSSSEPYHFDALPESESASQVASSVTKTALKSVSRTRSTSTQKRNTRSKKVDKNQRKITDLIVNDDNKGTLDIDDKLASESVSDEITTSIIDNHDHVMAGMSTPRKRSIKMEAAKDVSTTRQKKLAPRRLSDNGQEETVKKNLDSSLSSTNSAGGAEKHSEVLNVDKSKLLDMVSSVSTPPTALSPLAKTPESPSVCAASASPKEMSTKLQNLSQKLKALDNMTGQEKMALKNRLKQHKKIEDMKEKMADLSTAVAINKVKEHDKCAEVAASPVSQKDGKIVPDSNKTISAPAYQRYDHLTTDAPTLALPFSYRLLEQAFQAMDTVVSMMHNRSEMCCFSKVKGAVQNMTKKNFEEKSVCQMKSVIPDAYTFRQERNIAAYGKKMSGYQLTIEPNLCPSESEKGLTKEGKPIFTAGMMTKRRQIFKSRLLGRVMDHHKDFLSSLSPPIKVADNKITRWHPKFKLDSVPEVPEDALPQAPEIKIYHTAKDVLEKQRGKLNPRVEEALARVAEANSKPVSNTSNPAPTTASEGLAPIKTGAMKGVPPALLAKIRAKEAAKQALAMTRDPKEDGKTKMMGHLPEMMRIIRSYFLIEKKIAMPLETVYKKIQDSYRGPISMRDIEDHINLMKDIASELVTVVEIKRGKYLKLNKNADVNKISNSIMNQVKARE